MAACSVAMVFLLIASLPTGAFALDEFFDESAEFGGSGIAGDRQVADLDGWDVAHVCSAQIPRL